MHSDHAVLNKKVGPLKKSGTKKSNQTKSKATSDIKNTVHHRFPIVAIGASAGGLEALQAFFKYVPAENNMAFVVITHLDPEHKSIMPELIKTHTPMPVFPIKNRLKIAPNTVYVIPPNKNAAIKEGVFSLVAQDIPHYTNLPINFFLRSLALNHGDIAIAIILTGCGTDGSLGLRDIKQQGGIIIVQDPETAKYNAMPISAINTGLVDYVLPPEKIFDQLKKSIDQNMTLASKISPELIQVLTILRSKTRHDFSGYKISVLYRRIERQMQRLHLTSIGDYVHYLRLNLREVDHLFNDLLIGVTCFFRDPEAFFDLKQIILPRLLKNKTNDYVFRIWVPGCATGEEAYSIAMLIREYMDETKRYFHVQIFATDIDLISLETARAGIYPETISQEVSEQRLEHFFIKDKKLYKIKKKIREMIIFGVQNLIQEPPFTKLDLISCRNVLIYLDSETQQKLFPLFHYSLKPHGILFLGMSESASRYDEFFNPVVKKWKLFERRECLVSPGCTFLNHRLRQGAFELTSIPENNSRIEKNSKVVNAIKKILIEQFVSPSFVVDDEGIIIFSHGDISDYVLTNAKPIHQIIFDIINPKIKSALMPALHQAVIHKKEMHFNKLMITSNAHSYFIDFKITPLNSVSLLQNLFLVSFEKVEETDSDKKIIANSAKNKKKLRDVEQELVFTKENLQATIEELETSNEELQSTNEELQSINEELETSKEELQSVNEELVIVNTELQCRIEQIAAVNDDMNNLFNSTDIAAFFLDNSLLIKRFTPKAQELIHVIPADIGRSFKHFATNIKNINLVEYAEEVLKTLTNKTIEVQTINDQWYLVHILPYRTVDDRIDGVVITLTNITQNKIAEEKLSKLNNELHDALAFSENILDTVREPLIVLSASLEIISANRSFYNQFILKPSETIGKPFYEVGDEQWNLPHLRELLDEVLSKNLVFEGFEVEHTFPRLGYKKLLLNARKIIRPKTGNKMILLAIQNVNEGLTQK